MQAALILLLSLVPCLSAFEIDARNFTSTDGTRIYAEASGSPSNPALLWIHGNSFSGLIFDKQFNDPILSDHFYQVRMDLRGMGRSGLPSDSEDESAWIPEKQADDVRAVIEGFGLIRPVLLGWSYGGIIIADYLSQYRADSIAGIAMVDSIAALPEIALGYIVAPASIAEMITDIDARSDRVNAGLSEFTSILTYNKLSPWEFQAMKGIELDTSNLVRSWIFNRRQSWSNFFEANDTLPFLLIFGEEDAFYNPDYVDDFVQSGNWSSELLETEIIGDAGHAVFWDKPGEFDIAIKDWVLRVVA